MTTIDFITELFCKVDDQMAQVAKHPQTLLWPSEAVTIGLLYAIKGTGTRAFYHWLTNNYRPLFPTLPHRTRLLRLLRSHQAWTDAFLAAPSLVGVMDSYGIELIHSTRRIHLEQLPSYAPELNPAEGIWNYLKRVELKNLCCQSISHLSYELTKAKERLRHKTRVILGCIKQPGFY